MVEFKQDGLSAVAAFFGDDARNNEASKASITDFDQTSEYSHRKGKNKTLGVGATPTLKESDVGESTADGGLDQESKMKLLRMVGKKGKRSRDGDNSDVELDVDQPESEDDENEGRTSAIKEKKDSKSQSQNAAEIKKTKKKSKKERKQSNGKKVECNESNKGNSATEVANTTTEEKSFRNDRLEDLASYKAQRIGPDGIGASYDGRAPRRMKVRSKQKNIRKDTRGHKKPCHLIPGRSDFSGRGLTAETRAYLSLPEKPKHQGTGTYHKGSAPKIEEVGFGLAVDDLLNDVGESAGASQTLNTGKEQKPAEKLQSNAKKVKRSKCKNLVHRRAT